MVQWLTSLVGKKPSTLTETVGLNTSTQAEGNHTSGYSPVKRVHCPGPSLIYSKGVLVWPWGLLPSHRSAGEATSTMDAAANRAAAVTLC